MTNKQAVILCGIQVTGKTSFYEEYFKETHLRISLEEYKTRPKEMKAVKEAIEAGKSIVIDNTNTSQAQRKTYLDVLKTQEYQVICYYFDSQVSVSLKRNKARSEEERLPDIAIRSAFKKLEIPSYTEGFDQITYVTLTEDGFHCVELANIQEMPSLYHEDPSKIKQFIGAVWAEKQPYLEFFDLEKQGFYHVPAKGNIEMKRLDHKFCTGYYDHSLHQAMPCAHEIDLTHSSDQTCSICEALTGFRACVLCRGDKCRSKNQAAIERCKKDHVLYLAYFPDRIKVGVSRYARRFERILEQGAIYSMFIGVSNGQDIRRVETAISKLGITPQVTQTYKISHLLNYPDPESAKSMLMGSLDDIKGSLDEEFQTYLTEPDFNDFSQIYRQAFDIDGDITADMEYHYETNQSPIFIEGEIKAMFGSIAMIRQGETLTAYNLKSMEGYIVNTEL